MFIHYSQVEITGKVKATSMDAFPVTVYAFIHLTQVKQNGKKSYVVVADNPAAQAADGNGSQGKVNGDGKLHTLDSESASKTEGPFLKMLTLV